MAVLYETLRTVRSLRLLDISYCFVTGRHSLSILTALLEGDTPLSVLLCEGNILSPSEAKGLLATAHASGVGLALTGRDLIAFPIRIDQEETS